MAVTAITTIDSNLDVRGQITAQTITLPSNTVTNAMVNSAAAIDATKVVHQHMKTVAQESGTTANDQTFVIHTVYAATATLVAFECGCVGANVGNSTVAFDLLKNGSSVLNAVVTVDSGDAARAILTGTFASTALVDGDVLEVDINATVGTGTLGTGAFVTVVLREAAS